QSSANFNHEWTRMNTNTFQKPRMTRITRMRSDIETQTLRVRISRGALWSAATWHRFRMRRRRLDTRAFGDPMSSYFATTNLRSEKPIHQRANKEQCHRDLRKKKLRKRSFLQPQINTDKGRGRF